MMLKIEPSTVLSMIRSIQASKCNDFIAMDRKAQTVASFNINMGLDMETHTQ